MVKQRWWNCPEGNYFPLPPVEKKEKKKEKKKSKTTRKNDKGEGGPQLCQCTS